MHRNNGDVTYVSQFLSKLAAQPRQGISNIYIYLYGSYQSVYTGSETDLIRLTVAKFSGPKYIQNLQLMGSVVDLYFQHIRHGCSMPNHINFLEDMSCHCGAQMPK